MRILAIRNISFEGLGVWEEYLRKKRIFFSYWDIFKGVPKPEVKYTHIIVLGGPMGVYEKDIYPHLRREISFLEKEMEKGIPILGICLGCQIVAHILGARVYKGKVKEIGWFDFEAYDPTPFGGEKRFKVFQWHGDTFDIPRDAKPIGRTDACENQGFIFNKVMGIQFHLEVMKEDVIRWVREYRDDVKRAGIKRESIIGSDDDYIELHKKAYSLINFFLAF